MFSAKSVIFVILFHIVTATVSDLKVRLKRNVDLKKNYWAQFSSTKHSYFTKHWPTGVVKYRLSSNFHAEDRIKVQIAMNEIEDISCVTFSHKQRNHKGRALLIRKSDRNGCVTIASPKNHTNPVMILDSIRCFEHGHILHELMHALGFTHEHQRPDRDEYVQIMWNNIKEEHKPQFKKLNYPLGTTRGVPYDYSSILHYSNVSHQDAIDPSKPVLLPRFSAPLMGQRIQLDETDAMKINMFYDC